MLERGKFVVLYGANNLGKSTQVGFLVEALGKTREVQRLKYPIYYLEPTGPKINAALRKGLKIDDERLQRVYAQNRRDFEPQLDGFLERGVWVVAEDYTGTGIAWGVAHDIPLETMEEMNRGLLEEDVAILLDGERFSSGRERDHRHESGGNWERARQTHFELSERYGWEVVNANQSRDDIHQEIMAIVCRNSFRVVK